MKAAKGVFSLLVLVVTLVAVLAPTLALAQSDEDRNAALLGGGILLVCAVIGLAFYVYLALAVYTIANKTHTENAWLAWIPILNAILMVNIAKKPIWWAIIIIFVPLVNNLRSPGEYCLFDSRLDGDGRSPWQTQLVGHHDYCSIDATDHSGLSGLGGLDSLLGIIPELA